MRQLAQAVADPLIAMGAVVLALWLRYESEVPTASLDALPLILVIVGVTRLLSGWSQGLYMGRWRFGGFEEVSALARAVAMTTLVLLIVNLAISPRPVPLSACVAQGVFTLVFTASLRWSWRLLLERRLRPSGEDLTRVVVVGAGEAGGQLIRSMMRNPEGPYLPVALIDDDPEKRSLRLLGVPVLGTSP
ncbi:MAG: nucleoside-diphosphate sugar epimerase/dehydratase [Iamia sp.]